MIKHMRHLSYVSLIILAWLFFFCSVILYLSSNFLLEGEFHYEEIIMFDLLNYPFFFGIVMLNYEGAPVSLNVRASMQKPEKFIPIFSLSVSLVMIFSIFFSSIGYVTFGPDVYDLVVLNLPNTSLTFFIRSLIWVWILGSYPIQMFPVIHIIENYSWYLNLPNFTSFDARYYIVRTLFVIFTGILAVIIPKFGLFINLVGAFSGAALGMIIPVVMYEKVFKGSIGIFQYILNRLIIIIGIL